MKLKSTMRAKPLALACAVPGVFLLLAVAVSCGDKSSSKKDDTPANRGDAPSNPAPQGTPGPGGTATPGATPVPTVGTTATPAPSPTAGGTVGPSPTPGGTTTPTPGGTTAPTPTPTPNGTVGPQPGLKYSDVSGIIQKTCGQGCHTAGGTMKKKPFDTLDEVKVYRVKMVEEIEGGDMPPAYDPQLRTLVEPDRQKLLDWLKSNSD